MHFVRCAVAFGTFCNVCIKGIYKVFHWVYINGGISLTFYSECSLVCIVLLNYWRTNGM